ncbi:hypothetical protein PHLGIDRAFT_60761, partial [Phlebiopsis gigantea 11061_1 CR5-6]
MSFTNLYYKRAVGTPRACYVCYKPTTTVLATINTVDFIYVCDTHLTDPGFASKIGETGDGVEANGATKMGLSPEEIAKVKAEWEERQAKKKEKERAKELEKEKEKEKEGDKDKSKEDKEGKPKEHKDSATPSRTSTPATPPAATQPVYQRYSLHRDIFAMRLAEHRKRRQTAQAKELAPRLPRAP